MTSSEVDSNLDEVVPPGVHGRAVPSDGDDGERPLCSEKPSPKKAEKVPDGEELPGGCCPSWLSARWSRAVFWLLLAGYLTAALVHNASKAVPLCLVALAIFLIQTWDAMSASTGVDMERLLAPLQRCCARCPGGVGLGAIVAAMVLTLLFICWDKNEWHRLIPASGLGLLVLLGWLTSAHRSQVRWRPVITGIALQFLLGLLIMKTDFGYQAFQALADVVVTFLGFTDQGSEFVFGPSYKDFFFVFKVLPVIVFFSSIVSACYYLGIIQAVFIRLGWVMQKIMGTGYCESLIASANIFLSQNEAPLIVKPFLVNMTRSEIHSAMTSGFASIAGSVMAAYILFGVPADHLLAASVMSAPAALAMSKLAYPETELPRTNTLKVLAPDTASNLLEAMTTGVMTGMAMAACVAAMLVAAMSVMAFLNSSLEFAGELVGISGLTIDAVLSYLLWPLALLMGVPPADCQSVGLLIGQKTILNEFVAYKNLADLKAKGGISTQAEIIATYALCGFSNFGSIGVQVGGFTTLEPRRKADFAALGLRAMAPWPFAIWDTGVFLQIARLQLRARIWIFLRPADTVVPEAVKVPPPRNAPPRKVQLEAPQKDERPPNQRVELRNCSVGKPMLPRQGGRCLSSLQCSDAEFCHPERRTCAMFCVGSNSSDAAMSRCSSCMTSCPHRSMCMGFIEDRPVRLRGSQGGSCNVKQMLSRCSSCKDACSELHAGPVRFPQDDPSDKDVWITSYPKTGSTWVRHLVTNLYFAVKSPGLPEVASFKAVDDFIPFIEDGKGWTSPDMFRSRTGFRIWKTHEPFNCDTHPCKGGTVDHQAPSQCMCPNCAKKFRRVIYVYRNGYDTLASYFRFRLGLGQVKDRSSFKTFINNRRMYPGVSWSDHIRSWHHAAQDNQELKILWLRYESLRETPEVEMRRIAEFLSLDAGMEHIRFAINASSAETLQSMEQREGGVNFFKIRYNKSSLKFVGSGQGNMATTALWGQVEEADLATWQLHNGHIQRCLGYADMPPT
ncbi:SLC28A3 [Symbiodinium natans]|uniref:SLC28A3 protein n=1 Tax=Symbiodinium natans TaxID=878477 RepID=A0A812R4S9_9DINO|nr:SLC28A3 [Symbiodinium natans]